ncbi:MAG: DNA-binding protein WhiA [Clostridia bacterium]|nr:DNA-binding protein WhiA [Clostridia bacterium]
MSFTSEIKKEIVNRKLWKGKGNAEKKAALSAFIRTSGTIGFKDGIPTFFLVSETENVAEFFMRIFYETFGVELSVTHATMDRLSGRDKLLLQCPTANAKNVLIELGLLKKTSLEFKSGISASLIKDDACKIAYMQGAFLGGGSCTLPHETGKTGYHLEIVFLEEKPAKDFCVKLAQLELIVKLVKRKETYVVYIKSKELISDFLSVIGAENALEKLSKVVEKRDRANQSNRTQNCMAGNADKAAKAAVKQVMAIQTLQKSGVIEGLNDELKALANLRLDNPAMSLQELADALKVSKSCLNHRMRKLMETAEKLTK